MTTRSVGVGVVVAVERNRIAFVSDKGRVRPGNEDRILVEPNLGFFAVVDGVGGEAAGELAAETAVEILRRRLSRRTATPERRIREAIALANNRILELAAADPARRGMSCVLTVAVVDGDRVTVGHVGDTRLYLIDEKGIRKITSDHSPVGIQEELGELSEDDAMRHPRRNEILRDVGTQRREPEEEDFIEVREFMIPPRAFMLICSDGLSDQVNSQAILKTVLRCSAQPQVAVERLVSMANDAGGKDNVSVLLIEGSGVSPSGEGDYSTRRTILSSATWKQTDRFPRWVRRLTFLFLLVVGVLIICSLGALLLFRTMVYDGNKGGDSSRLRVGPARERRTLSVGNASGQFHSITAALAAAKFGDLIVVSPGEYPEAVEMRSGVDILAAVRRTAIITGPTTRSGSLHSGASVTAERVQDARLVGFRIKGSTSELPKVGIRLFDSSVIVEDVEIEGMPTAGVRIFGRNSSVLRFCYIHGCRGPAVVVAVGAQPRLLFNLISNRNAADSIAFPGIIIHGTTLPLLVGNRFFLREAEEENSLFDPSSEIGHWNDLRPEDVAMRRVFGNVSDRVSDWLEDGEGPGS